MQKDIDEADAAEMVSKLGFIMAKQAEKADMGQLSEDDYILWLEDFEPNDVALAGQEIMNVYNGTTKTASTAKKKNIQPTGK